MITSIAKLIASNLRIVADTLDPKPVVSNDYTIHIKEPGSVGETLEKIKRFQDIQSMVTSARF